MLMLTLLDVILTFIHLVIIGFNLLGWIWPETRKAHFICIVATAASWFLLGLWFGMGYCPVTDWQWRVKEQLGEYGLPASFIKYYVDKISGQNVSAGLIDMLTGILFGMAAMLSVYVNFFKGRMNQK
jgi:hypothetical protein